MIYIKRSNHTTKDTNIIFDYFHLFFFFLLLLVCCFPQISPQDNKNFNLYVFIVHPICFLYVCMWVGHHLDLWILFCCHLLDFLDINLFYRVNLGWNSRPEWAHGQRLFRTHQGRTNWLQMMVHSTLASCSGGSESSTICADKVFTDNQYSKEGPQGVDLPLEENDYTPLQPRNLFPEREPFVSFRSCGYKRDPQTALQSHGARKRNWYQGSSNWG